MLYAKILAIIALVGASLFAKHQYDNSVSADRVAAALAQERKVEGPKLKAAQDELAKIKADSEKLAAKRKAELAAKTKDYQNAIAQTKKLETDLATARGRDVDFERLLNTIADNNRAAGTGVSPRYDALAAAHTQCERDLREADEEGAATLVDLSRALDTIDALKN